MADAASWSDVVAATPGRRLVAVELPGHGLRSNEDFSFAGAVSDTLCALHQVAHGSAVHLVGSGLGATVALSAALAEPASVLSVLVAGFVPARGTSGNERVRATEAALAKLGTDAFVAGYLDDVLSPVGDKIRTELTVTMSTVRPSVIVEALGSALAWRLGTWPRSGPAAGVIHASADIRVTEVLALEFARELRAEIIRLSGPGHLAYLEEPAPFAEEMNRFHARIERAAGELVTTTPVDARPARIDADPLGWDI